MKTRYYVWRRNDGYVGSTTYPPQNWKNTVFEHLGTFDGWDTKIVDFIMAERAKSEYGNLPTVQ